MTLLREIRLRWTAITAVIRGRPVIYRCDRVNGGYVFDRDGVVVDPGQEVSVTIIGGGGAGGGMTGGSYG